MAVRHKVLRDVAAPARHGGRRIAIHNDALGSDDTVNYSFLAMRAAAALMTVRANGELRLLPSCDFRTLRNALGRDAPRTPSALTLNSLLIPTGPRADTGDQSLRFLHRLFQEFFLAEHISTNAEMYTGLQLPATVRDWVARMLAH